MYRIMPFRNVLGPPQPCACEVCAIEIQPQYGIALFSLQDDQIEGWMCTECYTKLEQQAARIRRHFLN